MPQIKNTDDNHNTIAYIWAIFDKQGRFKGECEMCHKPLARAKAQIHHTKYIGATIKDLMIVCVKCNQQSENKGLA